MVPEELTQVRFGKIIKDAYPGADAEDLEAIRQHAMAAFNLVQQAKKAAEEERSGPLLTPGEEDRGPNTAFVDGVRKFLNVKDLDIDLIDRINPFGEAYSIMSKTMSEERLRQIKAIIAGKKVKLSIEEARDLTKRAVQFKQERGRLPSITSQDPWEVKMAEGVAFMQRMKAEAERG